jgi:hypothetical protein
MSQLRLLYQSLSCQDMHHRLIESIADRKYLSGFRREHTRLNLYHNQSIKDG